MAVGVPQTCLLFDDLNITEGYWSRHFKIIVTVKSKSDSRCLAQRTQEVFFKKIKKVNGGKDNVIYINLCFQGKQDLRIWKILHLQTLALYMT